jgi:hypothetical protein
LTDADDGGVRVVAGEDRLRRGAAGERNVEEGGAHGVLDAPARVVLLPARTGGDFHEEQSGELSGSNAEEAAEVFSGIAWA